MEPRGLVGGIYRITEWIMRLSVINILWIICGLPFFFVLLTSVLSVLTGTVALDEFVGAIGSWLLLLTIIAPFYIFPRLHLLCLL